MNEMTLLSVPVGKAAVIESILPEGGTRRRLLDLGITPGERVECLFEAPLGSPRAYLVRGAVIALRRGDASTVMLRTPGR